MFSDIHLTAISQEVLMHLTLNMHSYITLLELLLYLSGANLLNIIILDRSTRNCTAIQLSSMKLNRWNWYIIEFKIASLALIPNLTNKTNVHMSTYTTGVGGGEGGREEGGGGGGGGGGGSKRVWALKPLNSPYFIKMHLSMYA